MIRVIISPPRGVYKVGKILIIFKFDGASFYLTVKNYAA